VTELPAPRLLGLPSDAVIAVPAEGLTLYRLIRGESPTARDFEPPTRELAERRSWPELLRAGLSHFLRPEQAERVRRSAVSRIAAVELPPGSGIYVARTGRTPGHVTVWARPETLVTVARVVV
jgi:hypothetical protein